MTRIIWGDVLIPPTGFEAVDPDLAAQYRTIASAIAPFSDLFLCETMSCVREAVAAVRACGEAAVSSEEEHNAGAKGAEVQQASGKPIWVSFTLNEVADGKATLPMAVYMWLPFP